MVIYPLFDLFSVESNFSTRRVTIEEIFVPLQCQMREVAEAAVKDKNSLRSKASTARAAHIKSRNCAH